MKTPEEMMEFFRSIPSKKKKNPYWKFDKESLSIRDIQGNLFDLKESKQILSVVREFFRRYYESFRSEAQVLCVAPKDAEKLNLMGVPILTNGIINSFEAAVVVLPQDNSGGTSRISEGFWQNRIVNEDINPIARIHSHHILNPYQSLTDYSTLNSGTLEMVIGNIFEERLNVCYWLDIHGTDTKAQTFVARENGNTFDVVPYKFNGPNHTSLEAGQSNASN